MEESTPVDRAIAEQIPGLVLYEDGSIHRENHGRDLVPASLDFVDGVASKDLVINSLTGLWVRIFLPHSVASSSDKAPLVLYLHGGGLCLQSPDTPGIHSFCRRMASQSHSVWVSVAYRLSPEHRLPTQYDDCYEALRWLQDQFKHVADKEEPWILEHGDSSNLFCAGESAGATILHYVAVRLSKTDLRPLTVRGLMFVDTGNLGDPLKSLKPSMEKQRPIAEILRACMTLALPHGVKMGDPLLYCTSPSSPSLSETPFPPSLITVSDQDFLYEGGLEYFQALKKAGNDAELVVTEGEDHCFHLLEPESEAAQSRAGKLIDFMQKRVQKVQKTNA